MKINEKNMAAFATSATPVDREGWLKKRGELNRGYQRRWFVLKRNLLFYFDRRDDKEPVAMLFLEGYTIELAEDEEQFAFQIVFHGPNNRIIYTLAAESQESMEQWMKALARASYDYMKLMVADLQRQLDAAEEETTMVMAPSQSPKAPPRQRHNPFNRSELHHRSQSVRSAPGRTENVPRTRITFRELHNMYGRRILADLNEWRHARKTTESPLISF
ncbi:Sesquipedalian-1 [Eufriesea mexicana]|uniref:sesquipedalian-1-like n=1 Tax=Eufriesea mexicana TaxID=516756 RepID=UPI00083C18D4|nr:PREDICTED: sesquipedalian-1-like [Eufriesea mexicana]OAD59561.1 Sesquipedalian-1 [Eufriesea mexicana]